MLYRLSLISFFSLSLFACGTDSIGERLSVLEVEEETSRCRCSLQSAACLEGVEPLTTEHRACIDAAVEVAPQSEIDHMQCELDAFEAYLACVDPLMCDDGGFDPVPRDACNATANAAEDACGTQRTALKQALDEC